MEIEDDGADERKMEFVHRDQASRKMALSLAVSSWQYANGDPKMTDQIITRAQAFLAFLNGKPIPASAKTKP